MFDALGNREAQDSIRQSEPDKTHCYLLRQSPYACSQLPFDVESDTGIISTGTVCPNNPYVRFAEKIAKQEARAQLLERAADVYRASKVGALGTSQPSIEVTLAFVYGEWLENKRNEAWQAKSLSSL